MYSFPGTNHNSRRKRVVERTKLHNISAVAMVFSLCLAQQAQAGAVSVRNKNCVWQGLSRTNQVKIHLRGRRGSRMVSGHSTAHACTDHWMTLHAGATQTVEVVPGIRANKDAMIVCAYHVEAEGTIRPAHYFIGDKTWNFACESDSWGVCACGPQ